MTREMRVYFLGDSFTQGIGDPEQLGWVGRVLRSTQAAGRAVTGFNLGIRRNTSEDVVHRCWDEVARRTAPDADNRLVLCFGSNDAVVEDGQPRVDPARTLDNLNALLAQAERRAITALVIGPPPVADAGSVHLRQLLKLAQDMAAVCTERRVTFIDVTQALADDSTWIGQALAGDGAHPGSAGYARMAQLVQDGGWRRWLIDHAPAAPPPAVPFPAGLTVRHPSSDDQPRVLAVTDEWWGGFGGEAGSLQRALLLPRLFFQHFTTSSFLAEYPDGRLAAFLIGFLSQSDPSVAYIHFVGVDPALRRHGVAAALYRRFFDFARSRGRQFAHAITSPGNTTSQAFHTGLGFRLQPGAHVIDGVPIQPDYDGPGLDRIAFIREV